MCHQRPEGEITVALSILHEIYDSMLKKKKNGGNIPPHKKAQEDKNSSHNVKGFTELTFKDHS